jgi:predicted MFS family arabinose efflux permease
VLAAPVLLFVNALTYLASFAALLTIRDHERPADRAARRPLHREIADGVRFVARQPLLRRITLCTGVGNLFQMIATTLLPVLVLRDLDISPAVFGLATSIGAAGGIVGAFATARIARWLGEGTAIPIAAVVLGAAVLLLPVMAFVPDAAVPVLIVAEVLISVSVLVYNITQVSFRQRICPPELLGRMNASIRCFVWGVMPIGGLLAGVLGSTIGVVPTMLIGGVGTLLSSALVVFSPLLGMRRLPDRVEDQRIGAGGTVQ